MKPASRIVFVRIGRMHFYAGPQKGDERPEGGGKDTKNHLGHEAFNFFPDFDGTLYGTFGIIAKRIDLRKIDPALAKNSPSVDGVLVVFVAPYNGGQRIVGWYRDATVYRESVRYPREVHRRIQEHLAGEGISDDSFNDYRLEGKLSDAVLLPPGRRGRGLVPKGQRGETGQSNVCYAYKNGARKSSPWIQRAVDFIKGYCGPNLLDAQAEAEADSFDAQELAAGFQPDPRIRLVVEQHAMKRAEEVLSGPGFGFGGFKNTSKAQCYDYTCTRDGNLFYVEVKGTQGSGASVILTKNEIRHWKKHQKNSIAVIVHGVDVKKIDPEGGSFQASGGTSHVCLPWILGSRALEPIQFKWIVSRRPGPPEA